MEGNGLIGKIPSVVGLMQALVVLDPSCNLLSGPIPSILGNLTYTEKLCSIGGRGITPEHTCKVGELAKKHGVLKLHIHGGNASLTHQLLVYHGGT
ncbi:hypothetical protein MKW98_010066 [Papaver atlanticum]|uniref:Uncharacterized protein n=1 Tax=Papaver atlanticum TaxID=357466 RepID=A0AAD4X5A6_9MAGN|nr:hypothetical protein MKW98_010066 [Papaver atlanticum]